MTRALLLDFDGVVFKSKRASSIIQKRCELYVQAQVMHPEYAKELNSIFYHEHGHTLLGMNAYLENKKSVYDFNSFVYDNIDYYDLKHNLDEDDFDVEMLDRCKKNFDCYLFSNAPRSWVSNICKLYGYSLKHQKVLDVSDYYLKPDLDAYLLAEEIIGPDRYDSIVFIDDSEMNIARAPRSWDKILYR